MQLWILYALLSAIAAALVAIFGKIGVSGVDSTLATTVRSIIMAVFLIVISFSLGKFNELPTLNGRIFVFIVLSGLAGAISWLFYFAALKVGPATGVAALDRLSILFVLIFAVLALNETFTLKSGVGAALVAIGTILLSIK